MSTFTNTLVIILGLSIMGGGFYLLKMQKDADAGKVVVFDNAPASAPNDPGVSTPATTVTNPSTDTTVITPDSVIVKPRVTRPRADAEKITPEQIKDALSKLGSNNPASVPAPVVVAEVPATPVTPAPVVVAPVAPTPAPAPVVAPAPVTVAPPPSPVVIATPTPTPTPLVTGDGGTTINGPTQMIANGKLIVVYPSKDVPGQTLTYEFVDGTLVLRAVNNDLRTMVTSDRVAAAKRIFSLNVKNGNCLPKKGDDSCSWIKNLYEDEGPR